MSTATVHVGGAAAPSVEGETLERIRAKLLRPLPSDRLMGWLLPLAVMVLGGIARFWRITRPTGQKLTNSKGLVFDETYYAHDSWEILHHGVETTGDGKGPGFVVHPPLGKWIMAVGEALFDHGKSVSIATTSKGVTTHTIYPSSPFSYRFAGALLGTLAILIVARVARRMFHSTALGVIAGILLALDGLEFVQSRTAMLDIYLMFWVLASFACLIIDRDDGRRRLANRLTHPLGHHEWGPGLGFRPWRLGAGICIGAACATKWDGAFYIPAFLALAVAWDIGARRTAGARGDLWAGDAWLLGRGTLSAFGPAVVTFVVVPALVYLASWTGWFFASNTYAYGRGYYMHPHQNWFQHQRALFHGWWRYQQQIWHYSNTLTWDANPHPYLSRPYGWLFLARPVAYYYQAPKTCGASLCSQEVLGIGNPALWWATIPAFVAAAWAWIARRDWRAPAILLVFAAGYLPWFREDAKHRVMFLFYMLPNVPFMVLAVTMAIGMALGRRSVSTVRQSITTKTIGIYATTAVVLIALVLIAATNLSWLDHHSHRRRLFLYFALPDALIVALAVTLLIGVALGVESTSTLRQTVGTSAVAVYLLTVVVMFGFFYPVLAGRTITYDQWHSRMWFNQCATKPNTHHENAPCWI